MRKRTLWVAIGAAVLLVTAGVVTAAVSIDFGAQTQQQLTAHAEQLFGVNNPLEASSTADLNEAQALAHPAGLVTLAHGLQANVVSSGFRNRSRSTSSFTGVGSANGGNHIR